jgi:hypothetical protein
MAAYAPKSGTESSTLGVTTITHTPGIKMVKPVS